MTYFVLTTDSIATGLLVWSLYAALIVLMGVASSWVFRKRSASLRHSIWFATSMCIVATPIVSLWVPGIIPRVVATAQARPIFEQANEMQTREPRTKRNPWNELYPVGNDEDLASFKSGDESNLTQQSFSTNSASVLNSGRDFVSPSLGFIATTCWMFGMLIYWSRIYRARRKLFFAFRRGNSAQHANVESLVGKLARAEGISVELTVSVLCIFEVFDDAHVRAVRLPRRRDLKFIVENR